MSQHLRRDLESIERRLLLLATQVEEAARRSVTALIERRIDLAEKVIDGDLEIDRREVELEEDCLKALALHQPVASDLRFITACLKINNDLERIGDLAANIAQRAISLAARASVTIPPRFGSGMMEVTSRMLRESIEAFLKGDAQLARHVYEEDDQVDRDNRKVIENLLEGVHEDESYLEAAFELFSVSKSLERIGDHATNIAEDVIYLVEGDIVRHRMKSIV